MANFSNADKLACVQRELKLRYRVYEQQIDAGRMTRKTADREIALMEDIAADYRARVEADELPLAAEHKTQMRKQR